MSADEQDTEDLSSTITRVISRTFELDGVSFSWWSIDDVPTLVTVSSRWFGSKANLTSSDPEEFAKKMARELLTDHYQRVAGLQKDGQ